MQRITALLSQELPRLPICSPHTSASKLVHNLKPARSDKRPDFKPNSNFGILYNIAAAEPRSPSGATRDASKTACRKGAG